MHRMSRTPGVIGCAVVKSGQLELYRHHSKNIKNENDDEPCGVRKQVLHPIENPVKIVENIRILTVFAQVF